MTQDNIPQNWNNPAVARRAAAVLQRNKEDIADDMMRKTVYDSDEDGAVDSAAGGTGTDTSSTTGWPYISSGSYQFDSPFSYHAASEVTISSGTATVTGNYHSLDTESDAASDDLDTLTLSGATGGEVVWLFRESASRVPWITNDGNIVTPGGLHYPVPQNVPAGLVYDDGASQWMLFSCGDWSLHEDVTLDFDNSMSAATIQGMIDDLPRRLVDANVYLDFADGTYTMAATTDVAGFHGYGKVYVRGNTGESGLHTNQAVVLAYGSASDHGLQLHDCGVQVRVSNLKISVAAGYRALRTYGLSPQANIQGCYVLGAATGSGHGLCLHTTMNAYVANNYVSNVEHGITSYGSRVFSNNNDDAAPQPAYGLMVDGGGVIDKSGTQPAGAAANERVLSGEIR